MSCKKFNTLFTNAQGAKTLFTDKLMEEINKDDYKVSIE